MKYKNLKTSDNRHKLVLFREGEYRLIGIADRRVFQNFGEFEVEYTYKCADFDIVVIVESEKEVAD